MGFIQGLLALLGRFMIATIFIMSAAGNKIPKFAEVVKTMEAAGIPQPQIMLVGAIAFLLIGGLSVAIGYKTRFGALLLLAFLAAVTYYFHAFWKIDVKAEPEQFKDQMIAFMKNLSLAGTMVFLIANGAGPGSLDARSRTAPADSSDVEEE